MMSRTAVDAAGRFGVVATLNETPGQTRAFIEYHLRAGADQLVVFFDDPNDVMIREYLHRPRVKIVRCTESHWCNLLGLQPEKTADKLHSNLELGTDILAALGVQWVIALDGDERLYCYKRKVADELALVADEVDVVNIEPLESIHHKGMKWSQELPCRFYKVIPRHWTLAKKVVFELLYWRVKDIIQDGGFFGHTAGRAFFRVEANIDVYNHHCPRSRNGALRMQPSECIVVLHFDCGSFELWKRKWHQRIYRSVPALGMSARRRLQAARIKAAMETDDKALYQVFRKWQWWSGVSVRLGLYTGLLKHLNTDQLDPALGGDGASQSRE